MASKQRLDDVALRVLFPEIELIDELGLRAAVAEIWAELWEQSEYSDLLDVPVSLKCDYSQVKHTQAVTRMALHVADVSAEVHGTVVDRDMLVAGSLLMDVSKVVEYRPGAGGNERTQLGALLPHGTATANLSLAKGIPLGVVHIVLAHSPNGGKAPSTMEAHILDWLDQLDLNAFGADLWKRHVIHFQP